MRTPLKTFQDTAVENAVEILDATHRQLLRVSDPASRRLIIQHNGCLLVEAPTGAGKTLIAGHAAERFTYGKKIVWFWFAPFSGLIEQSIRTIKAEFQGLSVKDARKDRVVDGVRSGDIFVTTWGTVAANSAESRKARTTSDEALAFDELVPALKGLGYHIGVVVDEAHHGFKKAQEALSFYSNVLDPEYTIMVTATPKDKDIETFKETTAFSEVHKIAVSREDSIDAGLIKKGVKAIAFLVDDESRSITDFEKTALRHGLEKHLEIEASLKAAGIDLKPLMLVQVDSKATVDTVDEAKRKLIDLGVKSDQIAVHTADEPDPNLLALANDENVRVLIFKVAVALGFDAPRAFTLVSMRKSKDADFGVQVVGRISRVHRLLQGKEVPDLLKYGYVVLADYLVQEGLTKAADRINAIKTQLASASTAIGIVIIGSSEVQAQELQGGQTSFWRKVPAPEPEPDGDTQSSDESGAEQTTLFKEKPERITPTETEQQPAQSVSIAFGTRKAYRLRNDLQFPRALKKEICNADMVSDIAHCIADQISLEGETFNVVYRRFAHATRRELDIFNTADIKDEEASADISMRQINRMAQQVLFEDENISGRTLHDLLIKRLREEFKRRGIIGGETPDQLEDALSLILASYPKTLREAKRRCYANFIEVETADMIPALLVADEPLRPAKLNIYGVIPTGLSTDEREFVTMLDGDTSGAVQWWHRSPERKPYSVSLVMPDLKYDFYPDFVVGVKGRNTEDNILLVEVKGKPYLDNPSTVVKARAVHKTYKHVMMLHWADQKQWRTVINDDKGEHNLLDQTFRFSLMTTF